MVFVLLLMIAGVTARRIPDDVKEHSVVYHTNTGYQGELHSHNIVKRDQHAQDVARNAANDRINKINDENDHRLRTNAYTSEVETTERIHQGNIYTNVKNIDQRNHGHDKIDLENRISSRPNPNIKSIQNKQKPKAHVNQKPEDRNAKTNQNAPTNGTAVRADDGPIWVWEPQEKATSAEPGSLDDRSSFSGDPCPTGKVKIHGVCYDKDEITH
ncbi:unnamed protein product [Danaus chrysippus]|uniref:(African queen) hypothetical protein n=1 Tax=Danaus chrysippus TaxID=151541 RepID=A0A8J2VX27_9NEOP|nr:unnamed protein product [Danaus chrysippus]